MGSATGSVPGSVTPSAPSGLDARLGRQHQERVDPRDLRLGHLHPLDDVRADREGGRLPRREQPVVHVAAGGTPGGPLVAQELAGLHGLARLHDDPPEVRIHAAVAVAVVDDDDDRQGRPQVLLLHAAQVRAQVAHPAHQRVEPAAGGQDNAVVRCHHPVAAEGGEVDAIVEALAVHEPRTPDRRPERQREADLGKRPSIAGQEVERRGLGPRELRSQAAGRAARGDDGGAGRGPDAGVGSRGGNLRRAHGR